MTGPAGDDAPDLHAVLDAIGETEAIQLRLATLAAVRQSPEALEPIAQERAEVFVGKLVAAPVTSWAEVTVALRALFLTQMQLEQERRAQDRTADLLPRLLAASPN